MFAALRPAAVEQNVAALKRELHAVDTALAGLARAIERAPDLDPLLAQMRVRQQERERVVVALASAETVDRIQADRAATERTVQEQMAQWRALVESADPADGRQLLREVLDGPLQFTPDGKRYRFTGPLATGRIIAGLVGLDQMRFLRHG